MVFSSFRTRWSSRIARRLVLVTALPAMLGQVATACAPAADPAPPAPVLGERLQDWISELKGEPGKEVFLRNDGAEPVTITEVQLTDCENLRQVCGTHRPMVVIAPGQTAVVFRVHPQDQSKAFGFKYEYRWRYGNL